MNPKLEKTMSRAVMKMARNAGFDAILVADEQVEQFHSARRGLQCQRWHITSREEAGRKLT